MARLWSGVRHGKVGRRKCGPLLLLVFAAGLESCSSLCWHRVHHRNLGDRQAERVRGAVSSMGVLRPELVMKSIVPVVMAGVLGSARPAQYFHVLVPGLRPLDIFQTVQAYMVSLRAQSTGLSWRSSSAQAVRGPGGLCRAADDAGRMRCPRSYCNLQDARRAAQQEQRLC